jgi:hypothetical protein
VTENDRQFFPLSSLRLTGQHWPERATAAFSRQY